MACLEHNKMLVDALKNQMHVDTAKDYAESKKIEKKLSESCHKNDKREKWSNKLDQKLQNLKSSEKEFEDKRSLSRDFYILNDKRHRKVKEQRHKLPSSYKIDSESPEIMEVSFDRHNTSSARFRHAPIDLVRPDFKRSKFVSEDNQNAGKGINLEFQDLNNCPFNAMQQPQNFRCISNFLKESNFPTSSSGSGINFPIGLSNSPGHPNMYVSAESNFYNQSNSFNWRSSNYPINDDHWKMTRYMEARKNLPSIKSSNQIMTDQINSIATSTLRNVALSTVDQIRRTTKFNKLASNLVKLPPVSTLSSNFKNNNIILSLRERKRIVANEKEKMEKQKKLELVKKEEKELKALNICFNCGQKNHRQFVCKLSRIEDKKLIEIIKREKQILAKTNLIIQQHKALASSFPILRHCPFIKRLREVAPDGVGIFIIIYSYS